MQDGAINFSVQGMFAVFGLSGLGLDVSAVAASEPG